MNNSLADDGHRKTEVTDQARQGGVGIPKLSNGKVRENDFAEKKIAQSADKGTRTDQIMPLRHNFTA